MSQSLYFIDTKLSDYQSIIDSLSSTDTYYLIDSDYDGLAQMATILSGYSDLDALHVFSHGSIGSLNLGSTIVNQNNIASYQLQLQMIGSSLITANGDILFYGCNVAQGDTGAAFISTLASYTGADVAASDDLTGKDGDWILEKTFGIIETNNVDGSSYQGTLVTNTAPTFGIGDGKITTDFGVSENGIGVAIDSNGNILVVGSKSIPGDMSSNDIFLARYTSGGTLDTTFGTNGKVITSIGQGYDSASGIAVQVDGKVLVSGHSNGTGVSDFTLVRYNANGTLDTSFGGDGLVMTDIGSSQDYSTGLYIQADGKILQLGYYNVSGNNDLAIVRYNTDGSLDTTFGGGDGKATLNFGSNWDNFYNLSVLADGKILLAGCGYNSSSPYSDMAVVRLNSDGSVDTTFGGSDGMATIGFFSSYDGAYDLVVQPNGKILVTGEVNNGINTDFALARFNSDGSIDTTFGGGDGKVTTEFNAGSELSYSVTLQSDGKILLAGHADGEFALVRYDTFGNLDTTFGGGDGKVTTSFNSNGSTVYDVLIQNDGKILVTGYSSNGSNNDIALARYNSDGSLDTSFDTGILNNTSLYVENSMPVVLDSDVQIYDAELSASGDFYGAILTLARHGGANVQDQFSGAGIVASQANGNVSVSGTTVGIYTYNGGALHITFNSNTTQSLVNQALQSIAYSNTSNTPPPSIQVDWTFNDGNIGYQGDGGVLSVTGSTIVKIISVRDDVIVNGTTANDTLNGDTIDVGSFDTLNGLAGNDVLNGKFGADTMLGGAGNDIYYVDNLGDKVYETTTAISGIDSTGTDLVISTVNYTLGSFVENLKIVNTTTAVNGTGNTLNNTIYAGTGSNTLDGAAGIDTLSYAYAASTTTAGVTVNLALTTAQATGISGSDIVKNFENLTGSNYADKLTGNINSNILNGGNGNDILNGGTGADKMYGGTGNDIYYVDNTLDVTTETSTLTTEIDTVVSSVTRTLGANIEKLLLSGTLAVNGTGNTLNNTMTGNAAANILIGSTGNDILNGGLGNDTLYGGAGNDTLTGGTGLDAFIFNTALNATTNKDTITDFNLTDDTIKLENAIFTKLTTTGTLNTAYFKANITGTATDSNDYIVYETDTGKLFYDADGNTTGGIAAIQIALIGTATHAALTAADFTVI